MSCTVSNHHGHDLGNSDFPASGCRHWRNGYSQPETAVQIPQLRRSRGDLSFRSDYSSHQRFGSIDVGKQCHQCLAMSRMRHVDFDEQAFRLDRRVVSLGKRQLPFERGNTLAYPADLAVESRDLTSCGFGVPRV
jgi:hypothetical protein